MPAIISETADIIAISKPAGLIVHSDGRTVEPSLAQWLAEIYPAQKGIGENWVSPQGERIALSGIVHRLDRSTSGVILAAKSNAAYEYLKHEFKARRVKKTYRAFVYGKIDEAGEVVAEIVRSPMPPRKWFARPTDRGDTRAAITAWRVVRYDDERDVSLLEIQPETGRTHQIRVHMAAIGHPIVSDHLYAPEKPQMLGFFRPALHALRIEVGGHVFEAQNSAFD